MNINFIRHRRMLSHLGRITVLCFPLKDPLARACTFFPFCLVMYWTFPPSIIIRTPWGIVSVKKGVARKSCIFTKNVNFAYIKHIHFTQISLRFCKFEDKNISFLMYWALLPSIKIRIPWDIVLIKQVLPENHAFLPKMAMLLRPYS